MTKIDGIRPKIENKMNELEIFHFDQIAAWSDRHIVWVNEHLRFKSRIEREKWVAQAKALAEGGLD